VILVVDVPDTVVVTRGRGGFGKDKGKRIKDKGRDRGGFGKDKGEGIKDKGRARVRVSWSWGTGERIKAKG